MAIAFGFAIPIAIIAVSASASFSRGEGGRAADAPSSKIQFEDVTRAAGIHFVHNNGAFGKKWLPETLGAGVAFIDYKDDGWQSIFFVNGEDWPGHSRHGATTPALYRNNHDGTFTDVTHEAGLAVPLYGMGVAVGDYDNDGYDDLFVTGYGQSHLFHNNGNGTLTDVTKQAGLYDTTSKSLGIAVMDVNQDGWPDILISNDTQPNKLYINNGNGTFTEKGIPAGIGFSEAGVARAGMGVAAADYDRSGYPSIIITNFSNQMMALYHNEKNGLFVDEAPESSVGHDTLLTLGFGCFFFDYDLDGWLDFYVADGHLDPTIENVQQNVRFAEPPHLFHNLGGGKFEDVAAGMGKSFDAPRVARGAAYGDINNDGAPDIAITTNGGPAALFRNTGTKNHSLRIKLEGVKSNRDGIGAVVKVTAGSDTQSKMLTSGSSYLSSSELVLTFGLASHPQADAIEIRWPSGQVDKLSNVAADQIIHVKESQGIVAANPLGKR